MWVASMKEPAGAASAEGSEQDAEAVGTLVTLDEIERARGVVGASPLVRVTPLMTDVERGVAAFEGLGVAKLGLKLESLQLTGSFKVRA